MKFCAIVEELKRQKICFDYFATGHYARIEYDNNRKRFFLKKALDLRKDQSYFLYNLPREQLRHLLFPLGDYKKEEVRRLAKELLPDLPVQDKPESQDFIAGGYHQLFNNIQNPGPILNTRGDVLGEHKGIVYYTIGQKKNLGIPGNNSLYVIAKDTKRNAVIVGAQEDLMGTRFFVKNLNWLMFDRLNHPIHLKARIRSQHKEAEARVSPMDIENKKISVKFKEPQRAITPGQAVVFYDGDRVAGGGIIEELVE
jgi:tRNA-specific 2-thiouridylase